MNALYLDVDGTLIDSIDHADPTVVTAALVWAQHVPGRTLYVWSGGGSDYAQTWADRLFNNLYRIRFPRVIGLLKDTSLPDRADVVVDDAEAVVVSLNGAWEVGVGPKAFFPAEFVDWIFAD